MCWFRIYTYPVSILSVDTLVNLLLKASDLTASVSGPRLSILIAILLHAAAKSLQSCPTLCDPIDGSPPGSPVPGILQARTLEWVAFPSPMHESEKWKWSCSGVRLLATPWTAAHQAPPSVGFARQEYLSGLPLPSAIWYVQVPYYCSLPPAKAPVDSITLDKLWHLICMGFFFLIVWGYLMKVNMSSCQFLLNIWQHSEEHLLWKKWKIRQSYLSKTEMQ